jgi:hypothetical protein
LHQNNNPFGNERKTGLITSGLQVLVSIYLLIFKKTYTAVIKLLGLIYLIFIASLFFFSGFVVSQIGSYEGIYGYLSGNSQYSDYALIIYFAGHAAYYTAGLGFLLEFTKLNHYEIALFLLA